MEARSLSRLVETVLAGAWRRQSTYHGEEHWRCVASTGLALSDALDGVDRGLVLCFGLLHDTRRENESIDPGHGPRAAAFAAELRAEGLLELGETRFRLLEEALRLHSDGHVSGDPTIGACWDADRLHLPRVLIEPDPARFSTMAALGPEPLTAATTLREQGAPGWPALIAAATARG